MTDPSPDSDPVPAVPVKFRYRRLTDAEVKVLAFDILARWVFGTWDIPKGEQAPFGLFMNVALAPGDALRELEDAGVVHIYQNSGQGSIHSRSDWVEM